MATRKQPAWMIEEAERLAAWAAAQDAELARERHRLQVKLDIQDKTIAQLKAQQFALNLLLEKAKEATNR